MGWLRKKFKQVKNAVKKVGKAIKKVVKKVTKSKLFKIIATVGAVLATGGAALGAFGGSFASSTIGKAIINSGKFFGKFNPTGFKPFASTGKFLGSTLGKATDFVGLTDETTRSIVGEFGQGDMFASEAGSLVPKEGATISQAITDPSKYAEVAAKTVDAGKTASKLARGTVLGDVTRGVVTNVGTGVVMQNLQPDPKKTGIASGLDIQSGKQLENFGVAYSDAGINTLADVYDMSNNLTYGTASPNFNTPMYSGETVGLTPVA
jgi:hypothetical protein